MKRLFTRRRWIGLWVLGATLAAPEPALADPLSDLKARIGQAQGAVKDLASRIAGQTTVVEELRGVTGAYVEELRKVDADLMLAVSKYRQAEADLARVEAEIARLEGEIAEKEQAVAQRATVYGTRLRAMYKFTRTSPLEQLLGARNFGEALQRLTMMQAVTRVDNRLLGQLRTEHTDLLKAREALQHSRDEAAGLRDELDRQRRALEEQRAAQASLVGRSRQEQQSAEAALSELDRQSKEEAARIRNLQAQYQRELEEIEQRRLEEQRRAEEQRRLEEQRRAQATATAQAQMQMQAQAQAQLQAQATAQARAQATATAQARAQAQAQTQARSGTTPAQSTPARPIPLPAPRPTVVPLPGSINTNALSPSSYNMLYPVANPVVTTEYGERTFARSFHTGIDLAQNLRMPILAAAEGIVLERGLAVAGKPSQSYGMMVVVGHDTRLSTLYAHLDDGSYAPPVKAGDRVKRGQIIGYIGMTGITSGPHLHFEVREGGQPRNPRNYLPR